MKKPSTPKAGCGTCSSRTWSGSGQQYDCAAAAGMPLPDEHHEGRVPTWCPLAGKLEHEKRRRRAGSDVAAIGAAVAGSRAGKQARLERGIGGSGAQLAIEAPPPCS